MLSVLIPIYNYNSLPLIQEIHRQLIKSTIVFEIICIDDHSDKEFLIANVDIRSLTDTSYKILDKNVGRSKIRNLLAEEAKFDWILFLDADVLPTTENFISRYLEAIRHKPKVVCGGIQYKNKRPNADQLLRYVYGKGREEKDASERKQDPYRNLLAANFLIERNLFLETKFNESLTQYGHEDTLLAFDLKKRKIEIFHIENPIFHLGIENNATFLLKSEQAIKNALFIKEQELIELKDIKLLDKFEVFRFFKRPIAFIFRLVKKPIISQLMSKKPSLFLFDVYKLGYLCNLKRESV